MVQLAAAAARALPTLARAAPAAAGASSGALAARALPTATVLVSMAGAGGSAAKVSERLSRSSSNSKKDDCCCPCEGGKGGGDSTPSSGGGGNGIATIADAIKSVSDSITGTIIGAGQAFTSTVNTVASGAKSIIGNVTGTITSAVSSLAKGITSLTASLGPVGAVIGGVASAAAAVTGAVMGVASSLASVVISIGAGILNTVTTIVTTVTSLVGNAVSMATSFVSTISGLLSSVVSGISSTLSIIGTWATAVAGIFAGIASAVGSVIGAVTSIISGIVSTITSVVGALTSAFKSVSEALGSLAGIAGEALGGFISAVQSCVEALISFSQNVTSISNNTGMSTAMASNLTTDLQSVGISSKESAQIFGSAKTRPELLNPRANMLGLARMDDPNFLVNLADRHQKNKQNTDIVTANSRLGALFGSNKAPDSILRIANMNPNTLRENINYGRSVKGQLGVGSNEIKAASEDLPLLMNRVSMFIDTVKMRFAADLLPSLEAAFSVVSDLLKGNAGNISNILKSVTRTIFIDGPTMAANAAITVIGWASALVDAFFNIIDAGLALAEQFGNRDGALYGFLMMGANFVDSLTTLGSYISAGIAFMQAYFENNMHYLIEAMITAISIPFAGIPGARETIKDLFTSISGFEFEAKNPIDAAQNALDNGSKFKMADVVNNMSDSAHQVDYADRRAQSAAARQSSQARLAAVASNVQDVKSNFESTQQKYDNKLLERSLSVQESQLAVSRQQLDIAKNANNDGGGAGQIIARMGAYLAQDAYRLTSR